MILRKNNISPTSEEISFMCSFSSYDCWKWLNGYCRLAFKGYPPEPQPTEWVTYYLLHAPDALAWMPTKHAQKIAEWVIATGIRKGYLIDMGDGQVQLSPRMGVKNGRPKET